MLDGIRSDPERWPDVMSLLKVMYDQGVLRRDNVALSGNDKLVYAIITSGE